ncbi:hypothetical protein JCM8097_003608 [Rhodosporidiobolus ruineniae]
MSGLSSPASLITVNVQSTPISIYSVLKIGVGLSGLLAPALCASSKTPFKYASRAFSRTANTSTANPAPGNEAKLTLAVRLTAARDIVLALLAKSAFLAPPPG